MVAVGLRFIVDLSIIAGCCIFSRHTAEGMCLSQSRRKLILDGGSASGSKSQFRVRLESEVDWCQCNSVADVLYQLASESAWYCGIMHATMERSFLHVG